MIKVKVDMLILCIACGLLVTFPMYLEMAL